MGLLFQTRIDIALIFNSFFFQRQQWFIWKLDTIWGFVSDPTFFPCPSPQLPIWDATCGAKITMAPSDRRNKKPKDACPWLWTAPRNSDSLSLSPVSVSALLLLSFTHASDAQQQTAPEKSTITQRSLNFDVWRKHLMSQQHRASFRIRWNHLNWFTRRALLS